MGKTNCLYCDEDEACQLPGWSRECPCHTKERKEFWIWEAEIRDQLKEKEKRMNDRINDKRSTPCGPCHYEINETSSNMFKIEEITIEQVTDVWDDFDDMFKDSLWRLDVFGRPVQRGLFEPFGFTGTYTQRRLLGTYDTLDKAKEELKKYITEKNKPLPQKPTNKRIVFDQDGKELSEK